MAFAARTLVNALRVTTDKLEQGNMYQWGIVAIAAIWHRQTIAHFTKDEIHSFAMERKGIRFCPSSEFVSVCSPVTRSTISLTLNFGRSFRFRHTTKLKNMTLLKQSRYFQRKTLPEI